MLGWHVESEARGGVELGLEGEDSARWIFANFFRDFFLDEEGQGFGRVWLSEKMPYEWGSDVIGDVCDDFVWGGFWWCEIECVFVEDFDI